MGTSIKLEGGTVLTLAGRRALATAVLTGVHPKVQYYIASNHDYALDPAMMSSQFSGWYTHTINGYTPVNDYTSQLLAHIPQEDAVSDLLTVGLFLEDGTLFALAKPPYAMPQGIEQNFNMLIESSGINELLDFSYIPTEVFNHEAELLNTSAVLLNLHHTLFDKVKKLFQRVEAIYKKTNSDKAELKREIQASSEQSDDALKDVQLSLLNSNAVLLDLHWKSKLKQGV